MAVGPFRTKIAQIFVTEESTLDTYETQSAGEGFLAEIGEGGLSLEGENFAPTMHDGTYQVPDEYQGPVVGTVTARVPIKGSGSAGTTPEYADALLSCGMRESIVAATSVTFYPWSVFDASTDAGPPATRNPAASYSVTILEDGLAYQLKGAWGNVVFTGNIGEPIFAEFTWRGAFQTIVADGLETLSLDATTAPVFLGASFATNFTGSSTPIGVNALTVDMGNQMGDATDVNDSNGIYAVRIIGRKGTGSFDPEQQDPAVTTDDYHSLQRAGTTGSVTTGAVGATAGNIATLTVNRCVLRPITQTVRNGFRALNIPFGIGSVGAATEAANPTISLVLT